MILHMFLGNGCWCCIFIKENLTKKKYFLITYSNLNKYIHIHTYVYTCIEKRLQTQGFFSYLCKHVSIFLFTTVLWRAQLNKKKTPVRVRRY